MIVAVHAKILYGLSVLSGGQGFAHLIHAVQAVGAFVKLIFVGWHNADLGGITHLHDQYVSLRIAAFVDHRVAVAVVPVVEQNHVAGPDVGWGRWLDAGID